VKGSYSVKVGNKRIKYEFIINRNITIVQGDSATGKTTLMGLIADYYEEGKNSGVHLECKKKCVVLQGKDWRYKLENIKDSIVFIDEGNKFISSSDFAREIKNTDNYYVIITREDLHTLPYSVNEIYGIHEKGSRRIGEPVYNAMYKIYGEFATSKEIKPGVVITEDSNSGYEFFKYVCKAQNIRCKSAEGKSNIVNYISQPSNDMTLIVADGAALGPEMRAIMQCLRLYHNYVLYLPESFEWLILKSGVHKDGKVQKILENPCEHIESKDYFSWEIFFTALLERITSESDKVNKYNKRHISSFYTTKANINKILEQIDNIKLT